jgi:hypothetical protein
MKPNNILFVMVLAMAVMSCNQESECETARKRLEALTRQEAEMRDTIPSYNGGKDMALARILVQKVALKSKLRKCDFE